MGKVTNRNLTIPSSVTKLPPHPSKFFGVGLPHQKTSLNSDVIFNRRVDLLKGGFCLSPNGHIAKIKDFEIYRGDFLSPTDKQIVCFTEKLFNNLCRIHSRSFCYSFCIYYGRIKCNCSSPLWIFYFCINNSINLL